jgi:hypothetical protein
MKWQGVCRKTSGGSLNLSEDIDVLIARKETELSPFSQRMEQLKREFIEETVSFASEWYKKTTKEYVTKYPEVTLGMKEEKITQMKAQVNKLALDAEKTVSKELEKPGLWWHQKPRLHDSSALYLQIADKYPEILDHAVRQVLGRLGSILEEYKFNVTATGKTISYGEFWFDHPSGNESTSNPYYPHLLKWSEKMQETIRNYNEQYTTALVIFEEIQKITEQKKRQQAMNRWDSI